jgi:transcriptional regulator of heat shock response
MRNASRMDDTCFLLLQIVQEEGRKGEKKKKKKKKMRKEQRDRKKNSILRSLNSLEQLSGYSEIVSVRKSFRKNHSASKFVKVYENELIVFFVSSRLLLLLHFTQGSISLLQCISMLFL